MQGRTLCRRVGFVHGAMEPPATDRERVEQMIPAPAGVKEATVRIQRPSWELGFGFCLRGGLRAVRVVFVAG